MEGTNLRFSFCPLGSNMAETASEHHFRLELRAVVYPHGEWWIAHCLELDLVAESRDPQEAFDDLMDLTSSLIEEAIRGGDMNSIFHPAPAEIWGLFSRAQDISPRRKPVRPVERFEVREAALV
jgi:hypothetical protein